jgi:glucose uptake protein GlcU
MPKFHDKTSLIIGMIASFILVLLSIIDAIRDFKLWLLYPMCIGMVLGFHCLDMIRYYKKHRIIKVVKDNNIRTIIKEN